MDPLRLVLFDVDGTLVDSQHAIVEAMGEAARATGQVAPPREEIMHVVGLSLPGAIARLFPELPPGAQANLVEAYRQSYTSARDRDGTPPLYGGVKDALDRLAARDTVLMGTATGMSRRGMARVIEAHGLQGYFATTQTADDQPSKPDPAMVLAALADTGVAAEHAVFVGDTVYDVQAGRAAGVFTIGVTWGYHSADDLARAGAGAVIETVADLVPVIETHWSAT